MLHPFKVKHIFDCMLYNLIPFYFRISQQKKRVNKQDKIMTCHEIKQITTGREKLQVSKP